MRLTFALAAAMAVACDSVPDPAATDGSSAGPNGTNAAASGGAASVAGASPLGASGDAGSAASTPRDSGADAAPGAHDAAPGTATSPCDRAVAFLCDDFESGSAGSGPSAPWDESNVVLVSTARAFSGTKSISVPEGSATLRLPLAPARDVVFARWPCGCSRA